MPAVYDRFVADAKDGAYLQRKWEIRHADGSVVEEVLGRLYFDLELNAKHLSLYIPQAREHIKYPERILFDQIRELLSIPDHEFGVATKIGEDVVTGDGLVFTGRVFVYSEEPVPIAEQQKVKADAAALGYRLLFRTTEQGKP
jgi:hypothetical protein